MSCILKVKELHVDQSYAEGGAKGVAALGTPCAILKNNVDHKYKKKFIKFTFTIVVVPLNSTDACKQLAMFY